MGDGTDRAASLDLARVPDRALNGPTSCPAGSAGLLLAPSQPKRRRDAQNLVHWDGTRGAAGCSLERGVRDSRHRRRRADQRRDAMRGPGRVRRRGPWPADLDAMPGPDWDENGHHRRQGLTRPAASRESRGMRDAEVYQCTRSNRARARVGGTCTGGVLAAMLRTRSTTAARTTAAAAPRLAATDTGNAWEVAGTGAAMPGQAPPSANLAAYLTCRPAPGVRRRTRP